MPSFKVVLDTNVVISAHLRGQGYPSFVLDLCLSSRLVWFISPEILEEYGEVLKRKRLRIDPRLADASLEVMQQSATLVRPRQRLTVCSDPDDNKFLECAKEALVDFLVTGNKRHFPARFGRIRVVNPRELIEIVAPALMR